MTKNSEVSDIRKYYTTALKPSWFVRPNNFPKVLEGNYTDKDNPADSIPNNGNSNNNQLQTNSAAKPKGSSNPFFDKLRKGGVDIP